MKIAFCFLLQCLNLAVCLWASDVKTTFDPSIKAVIVDEKNGQEINVNYPLEILSSVYNQWSLHANPALICTEHTDPQRKNNLTYKILSEIRTMCNSYPTGSWTLQPYQTSLFWNNLINWKLPRNYAVKFERLLKMGFEAETSLIKTDSWQNRLEIVKNSHPFLILEGDTTDTVLEKGEHSNFDKNVECHTVGGLSYQEVLDAVQQTQKLLTVISQSSIGTASHITLESFKSFLPRIFSLKFVGDNPASTMSFTSTSEDQSKILIRPQITLQIPLCEIPKVFYRLASKGHLGCRFLLNDLDPKQQITTVAAAPASKSFFQKLKKNRDRGLPIRKHFNEKIAQDYNKISNETVKGLVLLYLHYWYELFNGKEELGREPGLKSHLAVMSRIPFSQLYDSLKEEDKKLFRDFIDTHKSQELKSILREYKNFQGGTIKPSLNVNDWYNSIVNRSERKKIENDAGTLNREVDELSPPGGLPTSYSMGYFDVASLPENFVLIECRGYSGLEYERSNVTLKNLDSFLSEEAKWLFRN